MYLLNLPDSDHINIQFQTDISRNSYHLELLRKCQEKRAASGEKNRVNFYGFLYLQSCKVEREHSVILEEFVGPPCISSEMG